MIKRKSSGGNSGYRVIKVKKAKNMPVKVLPFLDWVYLTMQSSQRNLQSNCKLNLTDAYLDFTNLDLQLRRTWK